jgi:hypothetical protein
MKASLMSRLERLETDSPVIDEAKRIDRIMLVAMDGSVEPVVLWTRPGFVEPI